jgi:hypothetical protein
LFCDDIFQVFYRGPRVRGGVAATSKIGGAVNASGRTARFGVTPKMRAGNPYMIWDDVLLY